MGYIHYVGESLEKYEVKYVRKANQWGQRFYKTSIVIAHDKESLLTEKFKEDNDIDKILNIKFLTREWHDSENIPEHLPRTRRVY